MNERIKEGIALTKQVLGDARRGGAERQLFCLWRC